MKGIFYPDPNHDDPEVLKGFCKALPDLRAGGATILFLEFLFENVPQDDTLAEHYTYASGGRGGMTKHYLEVVTVARGLKMKLFGLSRPEYFGLSRTDMRMSMAFRTMGPFDGVAASIIEKHAVGKQIVVFLGAGHWPMLKRFLPSLLCAAESQDEGVDAELSRELIGKLPEAIRLADSYSGGAYSRRLFNQKLKHSQLMDGVVRGAGKSDSPENLAAMFQDKVGVPPTTIEINYLIARNLNTLRLTPLEELKNQSGIKSSNSLI